MNKAILDFEISETGHQIIEAKLNSIASSSGQLYVGA
ncbi:hypothetical protein N480_22500 [Pseudoalteromonas luteoviolacea S2607]|nr:hypothetical protein N480_22500 [Pseudoalteromonas luteoviolacea S2607]